MQKIREGVNIMHNFASLHYFIQALTALWHGNSDFPAGLKNPDQEPPPGSENIITHDEIIFMK